MKKDNDLLNSLDDELGENTDEHTKFAHTLYQEPEPDDDGCPPLKAAIEIPPMSKAMLNYGIPMIGDVQFKEPGPEAYDGNDKQVHLDEVSQWHTVSAPDVNRSPGQRDLFGVSVDPYQTESNPTGVTVVRRQTGDEFVTEYVGREDNRDLFAAQAMAFAAYYGIDIKAESKKGRENLKKFDQFGLLQDLLDFKPKQRCYIGIDNGVSGSIGIIREDGTYAFHKTPTRSELNYTKEKAMITRIKPVELTKLLAEAGPGSMVMIERPMVNPKMFKASTSALRAFEATIVVLETLGLAYEVCDSKEWQRGTLPKGVAGDALKPASMDVGNRLYPGAKGVKHPDRDGMLIAHFCKTKHR